jgi:hypothetical protein
VEETIYVKPVYDQVFVLKLVLLQLTDIMRRNKIKGQIRDLQAGWLLRPLKAMYGLKQAPRAW